MNCYNLAAVAQKVKKLYSGRKIFVAADDDRHLKDNPGLEHAKDAVAKAKLDGHFYPEFPEGSKGTDWNDYAALVGMEEAEKVVRRRIEWLCKPKEERELETRVQVYNAADLAKADFPAIKWAVEGILPAGCSMLFGPPKEGKSIFSMGLALAVSLGGYALGKVPVEQGDVCYLALEDTPRRLQTRVLGSRLENLSGLERLDFVTQIPRQDQGGLLWLDIWLRNHPEARLVIIDTLQKFRKLLPRNGDRYGADYDTLGEIKTVSDKHSVTTLVVNHQKKAIEEDWVNASSGSQGITGAVDTILMLNRKRSDRNGILRITGRDVDEVELALTFDPTTFSWILEGQAEEFYMSIEKRQIVSYLKDSGAKQSPKEIAKSLGLNYDTVQKRLRRMSEEGLISGYMGKYWIESK
jgi:DNA-binding Lrp family transcriptional regulator